MKAAFRRIHIVPQFDYRCMSWGGGTAFMSGEALPLDAAISLFESHGRRCCLISLDLATMPTSTALRIKAALHERSGLDPSSVLLNASHTHAGPGFTDALTPKLEEAYESELVDQLVDAVAALEPELGDVALSLNSAHAPGLNRNRRRKDGPVDSRLRILRVGDRQGRLKAVLWHFAAHPLTYHGPATVWCSDYPGAVAQQLALNLPGTHSQFLQGAAGDVYPLDWYYGLESPAMPVALETTQYMAGRLAALIVSQLARCRPCTSDDIHVMTNTVTMTARRIPWSLDAIQSRIAALEAQIAQQGPPQWSTGDHVTNRAQRHPLSYSLYAARCARLCLERPGHTVDAEVSGLRLADAIFVGIPGEPFSNVSLELAAQAPDKEVFLLGYTNGYLYYVPNQKDLEEVESWTLDQFMSQSNRWAYGATSSAFWSGESCEAVKTVAHEFVRSLATENYVDAS